MSLLNNAAANTVTTLTFGFVSNAVIHADQDAVTLALPQFDDGSAWLSLSSAGPLPCVRARPRNAHCRGARTTCAHTHCRTRAHNVLVLPTLRPLRRHRSRRAVGGRWSAAKRHNAGVQSADCRYCDCGDDWVF